MGSHGEVKTYFLSEEERLEYIRKYPIKAPLNTLRRKEWDWQRLTEQRYRDLRYRELLMDSEIIKKIPWMTYEKLQKLKKKWGFKE